MYLTPKQIEVLQKIALKNRDGSQIDLDELLDRLTYAPSKQAIQFTLRSLINYGLIERGPREKRRGRSRTTLTVLPLGMHYACASNPAIGRPATSIIEEPGLGNDLGEI